MPSLSEAEALARMVPPGQPRSGKYRNGVIQIWVTRACDKACFGCTQGSNLKPDLRPDLGSEMPQQYISLSQFEQAVISLKDYWGVVGMFGGNPAMHPSFLELCDILQKHIPFEQRGLWCNSPLTSEKADAMRRTFNPAVSNLNVHLDQRAFEMFKSHWPESNPFGLHDDSRHSPPFVAMKDLGISEGERWYLISRCDINQHWSAMIGVFRGQLRAWFCEVAGAQAMLHQHEPSYPDTGLDPTTWYDISFPRGNIGLLSTWDGKWWELPMSAFTSQVRKHCHECGIPLRGYGELAQADRARKLGPEDDTPCVYPPSEQTSETHKDIYHPKHKGRRVEVVTSLTQLGVDRLGRKGVIDYLGNAKL